MNTPWGKSDSKTTYMRGVSFVTTPSHGGFMVADAAARKLLSPSALLRGEQYGNYYAFEEDCDYAIVMLELQESQPLPDVLSFPINIPTRESLVASLSRWHADYLIERRITPDPEGLQWFNDNRLQDRMRADKSPDLIISAFGEWADWVPEGRTGVITADGQRWTVPASEYSAKTINLLSTHTDVQAVQA